MEHPVDQTPIDHLPAVCDDGPPVCRVRVCRLLDEPEDGEGVRGDAVVGPRRVVVLLDHALPRREPLLLLQLKCMIGLSMGTLIT